MDEADQADATVESNLKAAVAAARAASPGLRATGFCHWCREPVAAEGGLFCGTGCRDDYERQTAAQIRAAGPLVRAIGGS